MTINTYPLNTTSVNSLGVNIIASGEGTLVYLEQAVQSIADGTLVSIEQNVSLYTLGEGTLINIEQAIKSFADGTIVNIEQNVKNPILETFLYKNGFLPEIYIDGAQIPQNQIANFKVYRREGEASTCSFTLIPPTGTQNYKNYLGKPCFINVQRLNNTSIRIFSGWVDNPSIDIIEQKIEFKCSDRRQTQINQLNYNIIRSFGKYSDFVFGKAIDKADELTKRLTTVQKSFDFDAYGNFTLTDWTPKNTPDFILSNSGVYYEEPRVFHDNKEEAINTVNLTINYQYQRLHQQSVQVVWNGYASFISDWWNNKKPSFPARYTIQYAATATSWTLLGGGIRYVDLWEAGVYSGIVWQPNQVTYTYKAKTALTPVYYYATPESPPSLVWPDGKRYSYETRVLDSNGNPIYEVATTTIVDTSSHLCRGASWVAGKKFSQTINELYSIRLSSPQAVSRYGNINKQETINIIDPYNTSGWENDKAQYNPNITAPTAEDVTLSDDGYAEGATQLTIIAGGSGSFYVGNQFTIDGDPSGQIYTVAEKFVNIGSGGTLKIFSPGLASDLEATNYNITVIPTAPTSSLNFFVNKKENYNWLTEALDTAISKAETEIKQSHRDVTVVFKRDFWPEIDLQHTVETTATKIQCKGKVSEITHTGNVQDGEYYTNVKLLLSSSFESDSQSIYGVQYPPFEDTSYIGDPTTVVLQTHIGEDPDISVNPIAVTWNGYIGNGLKGNARTTYPESFIVDYPKLPNSLTLTKTVTTSTPGINSGVTTDNAGYAQGSTTITIAAGGTGSILQGDLITITGDVSDQVYVVQNDILDVSSGGILNIQPGLQTTLAATTYPIVTSPPANQFTVNIPNDPLTIVFDDE